MKFFFLFGIFLIGLAYIGYANAILTEKVSTLDRVLILGLAIAGNYFIASKVIEMYPTMLNRALSLFDGKRRK